MSVCKKLCSFIIVAALMFSLLSISVSAAELTVSAKSAILIDALTGNVLYEKNANAALPMASTTKIMTAIVVIENCSLDTSVIIPKEATGIEGSSIYLCRGEKLTVRQLLYALMLSSANDAATALAIACAGDIETFAEMMNATSDKIGLKNTHFDNPHGLDSTSHYTSAHDLAKLAAYALKLPEFKKIVSTYKMQIPLADNENGRLLVNHNKLLRSYKGAIGVKTGFTKKSGRCLVSAAERDGTTLIAVTLNAPDDWKDHTSMLDYGFENYTSVKLTVDSYGLSVPVINGSKDSVFCVPKEDLYVLLPKDHGSIVCRIEMSRFEYAPVEQGETIGKITYFCGGDKIGSADIISTQRIELKRQKYKIWDKIIDFFTR